jgi:uncharacterized protein YndB with AHSA1/START domain
MDAKALGRAETRSISIAAPPETVLELLGDARRLPDWAPAFALAVEPVGQDWLVDSGAGQLRLRVRVSSQTRDPVAHASRFMRVIEAPSKMIRV